MIAISRMVSREIWIQLPPPTYNYVLIKHICLKRQSTQKSLLILGAYAPILLKINFEISKKRKNIRMYISILFVLNAKYHKKWVFFVTCAKRQDKTHIAKKAFILIPNFIIFTYVI
jgi:hypothetical protein